MDNSGKNRYELLFMDDDVSEPLDNIVKKKVKQPAASSSSAASNTATNVGNNQTKGATGVTGKQNNDLKKNSNQLAGKENKSLAMNKNLDNKKSTGNNSTPSGGVGGGYVGASGSAAPATKTLGGKSGQQQLNNNNPNPNRSNKDNNNALSTTGRNNNNNNYKQQNGETREQRNNRRNRENFVPGSTTGGFGDLNNDNQHPQQQRKRWNNDQRNGGPPRNRGGLDGNIRGGKREFDRQSGSDKTGVKAVDKRDGAGAHNWGSVKQDIEDLNKPTDEGGYTDKEEPGTDQSPDQNPSEEDPKELTLDEWKAQRQQRAKPQFNIRKAGEGEDVTQWKKMIALNNKKKDGESEEEMEYDPSMYPQRVGRLQRVLDIQFNFKDGRRGGGGMVRGRGRGGQQRLERPAGGGAPGIGRADGSRVNMGRPRNENPRKETGVDRQQRGGQHAPKVDDERQFPTLS